MPLDMDLNIMPLQQALLRLRESLGYLNSTIEKSDSGLERQFKMATIQAFEFNYELAHKMIKRYLENTEPSTQIIDEMSFPSLIRTAAYFQEIINRECEILIDAPQNILNNTESKK